MPRRNHFSGASGRTDTDEPAARPYLFSDCRGTIVIYALLVIMCGAVVLAGWATMLATRSLYPDSAAMAARRRVAVANGRALARQYVFSSITNGSILATNVSLPNGWGGFSVAAVPAVNILSTTTPPGAFNPFSPGGRDGFEQAVTCNMTGPDSTNGWSFRLRSRSPIYAGYPLVVQLPASSVSSAVNATNALLWEDSPGYDFAFSEYQAPERLTYLAGGGAHLSPFPYVPIASESPAGSLSFSGTMAVTSLTAGAVPITDNATTTDDGISVTSNSTALDLSKINATSINGTSGLLLMHQVAASSLTLTINGTSDSALPPLHIICLAGNLTTINLVGSNQRRLYLTAASPVTIATSGSATWRMGALIQGSGTCSWQAGGTLTLVGGLRSNANIAVGSGGLLNIRADTDPGGLDSLADRIMWLEENRTE